MFSPETTSLGPCAERGAKEATEEADSRRHRGREEGKGEGEAKLNGRRREEVQEVKSSEEPASGVRNRTDREKTRHG